MQKTFKKVVLGGTFDHFHNGHKRLLLEAFEIGESVMVGITSDEYVAKLKIKNEKLKIAVQNSKFKNPYILNTSCFIQPYSEREEVVCRYLAQYNLLKRCRIIQINDRFGNTLTERELDAIIVSPETEKTAIEINKKRVNKGYSQLVIRVVDWVLAEDEKPIHSYRIRAGEIGDNGEVFHVPSNWGVRKLPDSLRKRFKNPVGEFIPGDAKDSQKAITRFKEKVLSRGILLPPRLDQDDKSDPLLPAARCQLLVSVGDHITHALNDAGTYPDIAIIDYHVERKQRYFHIKELGFIGNEPITQVCNPSGTLSYKVFASIKTAVTRTLEKKEHFQSDRMQNVPSLKNNYRYKSNKRNRDRESLGRISKDGGGMSQENRIRVEPYIVEVDGEEDLCVLFAILLAPLESIIVYGQPCGISLHDNTSSFRALHGNLSKSNFSGGIVVVKVTEKEKERSLCYLEEFEKLRIKS